MAKCHYKASFLKSNPLLGLLMDRYFAECEGPVWLSTEPGTRAEGFYRKAGWVAEPELWKGEVKFWMTKASYTRMASGHSAI